MKFDVAEIDFARIKTNGIANTVQNTVMGSEFLDDSRESVNENTRLLERAYSHWRSLTDFRKRTARARDYFRGFQWKDLIEDTLTKKQVTEEDFIKSQGRVPLKQNLIRQMVKNLLGQ